jgi:hypothetical protein
MCPASSAGQVRDLADLPERERASLQTFCAACASSQAAEAGRPQVQERVAQRAGLPEDCAPADPARAQPTLTDHRECAGHLQALLLPAQALRFAGRERQHCLPRRHGATRHTAPRCCDRQAAFARSNRELHRRRQATAAAASPDRGEWNRYWRRSPGVSHPRSSIFPDAARRLSAVACRARAA